MSSSEPPAVERALDELAHHHAGRGELEAAAWTFLRAAHLAYARRDLARATRCHALAVHAAERVAVPTRTTLVPSLLLLESELAAEAGDVTGSASLSVRALAGFKAAGDEAGVIAVWTARTERALAAGNLDAAYDVARELLPALDARGDREVGVWLRVRIAAALARADRRPLARPLLVEAAALTAPGTGARLAISADAMRLSLDDELPHDALAIAADALDADVGAARELRGELLVLCAVALAHLGDVRESARFAARAAGLSSPGLTEARARLAAATP